ncbi:Molybdopterin synthase catalytic subunit [Vibrio aerogenes CECT 7868]|uniref:Molybdopterin synthase catalytic subunit n=1 Tax=Vibrio aerogenes CECT 7868 TaxID=1216006 RepID=A0A1M6B399_9VIBR|nr:molybdopterin synthase catalytic subunit MoaE [Vibrio aerogenes]SHI43185.1 Molybdopterin synthase catalytic subunit [Vibrio aerogenes CECT 7868]
MAHIIRVQQEDFSVGEEYERLSQDPAAGAVATFVGKVRNHNLGEPVSGLALEHYPGMTEKVLEDICDQAASKWPLLQICVIHRVGRIRTGEQIVFVGVSSAHRNAAFAACEFIMDILKTKVPFWKKEWADTGDRWLDSRESDHQAAQRWEEN